MENQINKQGLLDRISAWDSFLKRKVHLIACGGTAMTLLAVKDSTKDIDLIVPNEDEHDYLIHILQQLGYKSASGWGWSRDDGFIFDLFRGMVIDNEDCLALLKAKQSEIDLVKLEKQFREAASYDVSEAVVIKNWEHFLRLVKKEAV